MAKQIINTERIAESVNRLQTVNDNIDRAFSDMQRATRYLDSYWKGEAGEKACTTLYQLYQKSETRSAVIQNYVNMLSQQVNPGYFGAESSNKTLADNFK